MRKRIIVAACLVAVIGIVWSTIHARQSKIEGQAGLTDGPAAISPHEAMVKRGNTLPVEYWADPF
jgi:hypothetical protein